MKKRIMAMLLTIAMATGMIACGSKEETKQSSSQTDTKVEQTGTSTDTVESTSVEPEVIEPVTITLYPLNANLVSGTVGGWLGEYLLEKGFILEIWPYSKEKLQAMLTSGDLPDLFYMTGAVDKSAISDSGLLLDLEPYMDLMPHVTENEKLQVAIDYSSEKWSDGVINMLPTRVGSASPAIDTLGLAVKLNWKVYEEIGSPKFNTWDELIEVLKKMQAAHPVSDITGDKTYALHLYPNDKSYFYSIYNWFAVTGYTVEYLTGFIEADIWNESFDYILDDGSNYKKGLTFFNKMYREGLMDPESINKDRATQEAIIQNDGALAGWAGVPGWEQWGYYPVIFDKIKTVRDMTGNTYGAYYIGASAETKNPEAVCRFLDMMANPDDLLTIACGPEGELWELDDNNQAVVTQEGIDHWVNGITAQINGQDFSNLNTQWLLNTGEMTSFGVNWSIGASTQVLEASASSDIYERWKAFYGVDNYLTYMKEKDQVRTELFYKDEANFREKISDELSLSAAAAREVLIQASWKMVYAESDEEFEKIWDEAVAECERAGVKAVYEWWVGALKDSIAARDASRK